MKPTGGFVPLKEIFIKFKIIENIFGNHDIFLITLEKSEYLRKLDLLFGTVTNGLVGGLFGNLKRYLLMKSSN